MVLKLKKLRSLMMETNINNKVGVRNPILIYLLKNKKYETFIK